MSMTKVLGLFCAAVCLTLGLGQSASAQTLQAGAIALTPGSYLTLDDLTITVNNVSCSNGGASCPDLFLAPTSGPGASIIIEAATGDIPGTSLLEPILSYTCPGTGSCNTSGTYDLSVGLDVQENGTGTLTGVAGTLVGSASSSSLDPNVTLGETVTDNSLDSLCNETNVNPSAPSFACNFGSAAGPQTDLSVTKDLGLSLNGVVNGTTLTLNSVKQSFTPAPEPASLATLLGGVVALGAARRKRRRA
jgi:hypothetical protein